MDGVLNQPSAVAETAAVATNAAVATLTRAMVAGDEASYREFHESYCPRLQRYLLVIAAGDEDAAREALQAACIRVVRHIKVFADEAHFWNWLAVLARSAFLDQTRKQRRYFSFLDRFTRHARVEFSAGEDGGADARLLALLEESLASLPPEERELVERKYFHRQAIREIAAAAQTSEKAVESRLGRVRQKLKAALLAQLKHEQAE